jgi:hypothetical protein
MRRKILVGLSLGVMTVLLFGAASMACGSVEVRLGLPRGSARPVRTQVDLAALHRGVVAWSGLYETDQPLLDTWHRLPRLAVMELEEGVRSTDQCLRLSQVERYYFMGRQTSVRLCAMADGTLMYVSQRLYWRPNIRTK